MLTQNESSLWEKIRGQAADAGVPRAVCSTITPFPFWVVIAAIVVFLPLALIASFVIKRQAVVLQGDEVVIYQIGVWSSRIQGEPERIQLRDVTITLEGSKLLIGADTFHLQPGWSEPAERAVALAAQG